MTPGSKSSEVSLQREETRVLQPPFELELESFLTKFWKCRGRLPTPADDKITCWTRALVADPNGRFRGEEGFIRDISLVDEKIHKGVSEGENGHIITTGMKMYLFKGRSLRTPEWVIAGPQREPDLLIVSTTQWNKQFTIREGILWNSASLDRRASLERLASELPWKLANLNNLSQAADINLQELLTLPKSGEGLLSARLVRVVDSVVWLHLPDGLVTVTVGEWLELGRDGKRSPGQFVLITHRDKRQFERMPHDCRACILFAARDLGAGPWWVGVRESFSWIDSPPSSLLGSGCQWRSRERLPEFKLYGSSPTGEWWNVPKDLSELMFTLLAKIEEKSGNS